MAVARLTAVPESTRQRTAGVVVALTTAGWIVIYARHPAYRYTVFLAHAFDMGQMIQGLWLIRHGKAFFSTITGLSMLGDHARLILFPVAFVFPASPAWLVTVQAAALASMAVAVYLLARDTVHHAWVPAAAALLLLLSPPLQWMSLYDFHPEVFAAPLLLWAFYAATRKRWIVYALLVALALLCREDVGIALVLLGAAVAIDQRNVRIGAVSAVVGAAWWVVAGKIIEAHNPFGQSIFAERYGWLGRTPVSAAFHLVTRLPDSLFVIPVLACLIVMVFALYGALPFALLAPPRIAWLPLPLMLANAFSSLDTQRSIYFHYTYLVYPFLAICLVRGFERFDEWSARSVRVAVGAVAAVVVIVTVVSFTPFTDVHAPIGDYLATRTYRRPAAIRRQFVATHPAGYVADARRAMAAVTDDRPVSAPGNLLAHLARRQRAYMFPNPFYPYWYGAYLSVNAPEGTAATMPSRPPVWVLRDTAHGEPEPAAVAAQIDSLLQSHYAPVFRGTYITVWRLQGT